VWPTVWRLSLTVCISYLATLPIAKGADLTPPPPGAVADPGTQFEARFGVFDHGVGSAERNTVDINGSFVTPRLNLGIPGYGAYLLPRFQLGGAANLAGRTSFGYADVLFTLPITKRLFFEPFVGGATHDGSLAPTPTLVGLGCPLLFHAGVSVGVPITEHWRVLGTFEHLSNGKPLGVDCGTNQRPGGNQGLNNYGVSVGYAF
jgi:Lipid A 3-O-deacylase (PagL)